MDGFDTSDQVIVIAATNRPDVLDPALLRPGRFDRRVVVDMADMNGRQAILEVHAKKVKMDENVDLSVIARATVSFSGADLENLINEAALIAVMRDHEAVEMDDLEEARDKVLWGKERRSRKLEESDRRITAFHEAGHAICSWFTPHVDKPHKVTIMPRGISYLGATFHLPEKERYIVTRRQMLGEVVTLYGGIASEGRFCDDVSSGASNDIKQATDIVRKMVTRWGMSDKLGPLSLSDEEEHVFLGYEIGRQRQNSEATNEKVDAEIKRLATECFERAKAIIAEHASDVEKVAQVLLEREVLNREEIRKMVGPHVDEKEEATAPDGSQQEAASDADKASSGANASEPSSDTPASEETSEPAEEGGSAGAARKKKRSRKGSSTRAEADDAGEKAGE
jgi:cell division protease FtsH